MKLITLNSHSLAETDYELKLKEFELAVLLEKPQIIALQEVNQRTALITPENSRAGKSGAAQAFPAVPPSCLERCGYIPCSHEGEGMPPVIRKDNHAFRAARYFARKGLPFYWTWFPSKVGYGIYDEGLALFSRLPILNARQFYITGSQDYFNWKTRSILGITVNTDQGAAHFYSVHMGWWEDGQEPFAMQWRKISETLAPLYCDPVWLMGDFNSPSHLPRQGRDLIRSSGWLDTYELAENRDQGITVSKAIDGWKQQGEIPGMRIDYIWTNRPAQVKQSKTIFNNILYPPVSDHFGVLVELYH